jgi:acetylcholinesterase
MPTWRYYYNDSFPNIFMEGYPDLGSYHTSDLSLIWGIYPTEGATEREVELSKSIQAAWAGFVKDPWGAGPGWEKVNGTHTNLACWGCDSGTQATIIDDGVVDARCPYYEGIYPTVTTPYF